MHIFVSGLYRRLLSQEIFFSLFNSIALRVAKTLWNAIGLSGGPVGKLLSRPRK